MTIGGIVVNGENIRLFTILVLGVVWFYLLNVELRSRDEEDKGLGEIIVSKHRNGPTGSVDISFISRYAKFENLSKLQTDFIPDDIPV